MLIKPKEPTPHFREAEKMNELLLTEELAFARFGGVTPWFSHSIVYSKIKKTFTNANLIENTRVRSLSVTSVLHCTRYLFFSKYRKFRIVQLIIYYPYFQFRLRRFIILIQHLSSCLDTFPNTLKFVEKHSTKSLIFNFFQCWLICSNTFLRVDNLRLLGLLFRKLKNSRRSFEKIPQVLQQQSQRS